MPLYEFKCKVCKMTSFQTTREPEPCQLCQAVKVRKFSFNLPTSFQPHFNPSIGKYVTSQRQFDDELKHLSDEQSERTGIYSNYVSVEQGDRDTFKPTDEGMDSFYEEHYKNPITETLD